MLLTSRWSRISISHCWMTSSVPVNSQFQHCYRHLVIRMAIWHPYWHLVIKNGKIPTATDPHMVQIGKFHLWELFTLLLTSSDQERQFNIWHIWPAILDLQEWEFQILTYSRSSKQSISALLLTSSVKNGTISHCSWHPLWLGMANFTSMEIYIMGCNCNIVVKADSLDSSRNRVENFI